jgi:hypothetical protein
MVSHVVLMKPRADLTLEDRQRLVDTFARAMREIPSVRGVRIGQRVVHGAAYEQNMPDIADFLAIIDFEDLAGLQAYLSHPAHQELATLFYRSLSSGFACDFGVGGVEMLHELV